MLAALRAVPAKPVPVLDAVLGWVAVESRRFRPAVPSERAAGPARAGALDVALVASVAVGSAGRRSRRLGELRVRQKLVSRAAPIRFSPMWMWSRCAVVASTRRRGLPRRE